MESNTCDINQLDTDVLLPPRKRLLAGLKRQNSDVNSSPGPSTGSGSGTEFDIRLSNLLKFHLSNPNASNQEILDASKNAAIQAVKVAKSARAVAEEKAAKAAKAVANAKSALELVANLSEDRVSKRNKMKKRVPVQTLYSKDEELAMNLHRVINSSPRILKNSVTEPKNCRTHKKMIKNSVTINGDSEDSVRVDLNVSNMENGEGEGEGLICNKTEIVKKRALENLDEMCSNSRKKGKLKQKKLPLSICNFRDEEANPKEEMKLGMKEGDTSSNVNGGTHFQMGANDERLSLWKCQTYKAPQASSCVKQNKVTRS